MATDGKDSWESLSVWGENEFVAIMGWGDFDLI